MAKEIGFKKKGLLTSLSVHDIETVVRNHFGGLRSRNIIIPNVSWGAFYYEMDVAIITPKFYLYEVEIKRSWTDFMADFKKLAYHDDERVHKFYYCVPKAMAKEVVDYLDTMPNIGARYAGVLGVDDGYKDIFVYREAKIKNHRPIGADDVFRLCRLGNIRFWSHRNMSPDTKIIEERDKYKFLFEEAKHNFKAATGEDYRWQDWT